MEITKVLDVMGNVSIIIKDVEILLSAISTLLS